MANRSFQLTRSRGAWLGETNARPVSVISTHTLTWSVTAVNDLNQNKVKFQLTRSRGAWQSPLPRPAKSADFNSHAHVERDRGKGIAWHWLAISTHTLTWSVTEKLLKCRGKQVISTHTLTWSVTRWNKCQTCVGHFNSHAHVERDVWNQMCSTFTYHFNSHAHVERDGAHRRRQVDHGYFNSHAHVERDVLNLGLTNAQNISTHTLTWSVTNNFQ